MAARPRPFAVTTSPAVAAKTRGEEPLLSLLGDRDLTKSLRYPHRKAGRPPRSKDPPPPSSTPSSGLNDRLAPLKAAVIQACLIPVLDELDRMTATTGAFDFDSILAGAASAVVRAGGTPC